MQQIALNIAAEPVRAKFEDDGFNSRSARFHLIKRLHGGEARIRARLHRIDGGIDGSRHNTNGRRSGVALSFLIFELADEFAEIARFAKVFVD